MNLYHTTNIFWKNVWTISRMIFAWKNLIRRATIIIEDFWTSYFPRSIQQYGISEWAEFQVWKFLHLQKLALGKKNLPPKGRRPAVRQGFSSLGLIFGGEEISIPETHGPFRNCIPVRVNQVMKDIEISQWASHTGIPFSVPINFKAFR